MDRKPLRHLNESAILFGLKFQDFFCLLVLFASINIVFDTFGADSFSLVPLIITLASIPPLSFLRLRYRRHIIRDFISNLLTQGLFYDPRNPTFKKNRQ